MPYLTNEHRVRNFEIVCAFIAGSAFMGMSVVLLLIMNGGLSCR